MPPLALLLTLAVLLLLLASLIREWLPPDLSMLTAVVILMLGGILSPAEAFGGFADPAVITIAAMFVVASGVRHSDALSFIHPLITPRSPHVPAAILRLMLPASLISGFINNTPVVAILTPLVQRFGARAGIAPSKLLIPMTYATTLGGMVTLIGTSTNLIIAGLLTHTGLPTLSFWDLAVVGVPAVAAGILYFLILGHRLLPDHGVGNQSEGDPPTAGADAERSPARLRALAIVAAIILLASFTALPLVLIAVTAALAMILMRVLSPSEARRGIHLPVVILVGAGLGLAKAVERSGLAHLLADSIVDLMMPLGVTGVLVGIYVATNLLTETLTNAAAAVLMFPIGMSAAAQMDANPLAFAVAIAIAASAGFSTPIGYQTNLMVMAPGRYRFRDYARVGIPLNITIAAVTIPIILSVW